MPRLKEYGQLSESTKSLHPKRVSSRLEGIAFADLAGHSSGEIARMFAMTVARISLIKSSPLFKEIREVTRQKLQSTFVEKQSDKLVNGDPIRQKFKEAALDLADEKIKIALRGKSEAVRSQAINDALGLAGYRQQRETQAVTVEVTEKIASRFERALLYRRSSESGTNERRTTLRVASFDS